MAVTKSKMPTIMMLWDLIKNESFRPRKWEVDEDAVKSVAEEYIG